MNHEPIFTADEDKCDHVVGYLYAEFSDDSGFVKQSYYELIKRFSEDILFFNYCPICGEKL